MDYAKFKTFVVASRLTCGQVIALVPEAMQMVANLPIPGQQKKETVFNLFQQLINDPETRYYDEDEQRLVQKFINDGTLKIFIDIDYQAFQKTFQFKTSTTGVFDVQEYSLLIEKYKRVLSVNGAGVTGIMGAAENMRFKVAPVTITNILTIIPTIMQDLATYQNLSGLQKRDYVVQIITEVLGFVHTGNPAVDLIVLFVRQMIPPVVDVIYNAANNKYFFDELKSFSQRLRTLCCKHV